jgi:signal transduction histidine kinase
MALLYGGLVLLVGVSLLFTSMVLLDRSIARLPFFNTKGTVTLVDGTGVAQQVRPSDLATQARHDSRDYLLHTGLIYFAVIVIVGASGGYLLARQALRPIARVTRTAKQLSTETLDQRIDLGGPDDELRELADTFDEMLARLDAAFDGQKLFVANASHELRTPLSVIRTELDVTLSDPKASNEELRQMGEVALAATERAQRLVGSLLILARLQSGHRSELEVHEPVDLASLVPAVLASVATEATERSISIDTEAGTAHTLGDPRLLERLIGNLVENAVRHNVDGGWLRVSCGEAAERAWLHVANGGQVIPPGEVDVLFEPFRRGAGKVRTATRGAGLGLSIVRLIVEAHHGRLQAAAPPFGGLAIRIELPRAAGSAAGAEAPAAAPELLGAERLRQRGAGEVDLPGSRA